MRPRSARIRTRLLWMLAVVSSLAAVGAASGSYSTWVTITQFREVVKTDAVFMRYLLEIKAAASELEAKSMGLELASSGAAITDGTTAAEQTYELLSSVEQVARWAKKYSKDADGGEYVERIVAETNEVVVRVLDLALLRERGAPLGELIAQHERVVDARARLRTTIEEAGKLEQAELAMALEAAERASHVSYAFQLATILAAILAGISFSLAIARGIVNPLNALRDATVAIARGEVGRRATKHSDDEVGELTDAFNAMADWLQLEIMKRTAEETKLRSLLETSPLGVMTFDPDGHILLANAALERMLGFETGELCTHSVGQILPDIAQMRHDGGGPTALQPARGRAKTGVEVPLEVSLRPIALADGDVTMATVADVRERQRIEEQLRRAEKLSAVGQLAAGVAHEINNPLTVILGFAQGLVRRAEPGDGRYNPLTAIVRETLRCKELVRSLLTFSRAGGTESGAVDVNTAVGVAIELVAGRARMQSANVCHDLAPDLPAIFANQNQLEQVLVNLLQNALDAVGGEGTVTIRTHTATIEGRPAVQIDVEDTGSGMSEETRARIFEPFFTTKAVGRGTGLGLSLAFEMVSRHKGTIHVDSTVGVGSTFRVQLLAA